MKKIFVCISSVILFLACKKTDSNSGNTAKVSIGDSALGGRVAYILQSGDVGYDANVQHGIIAAAEDLGKMVWFNNGTFNPTGATGTAIGTGKSNTKSIVFTQGNGYYAAQVCDNLEIYGYDDWYLPSRDELNQMFLNRYAIGGFQSSYYWSSSEYTNKIAWSIDFVYGNFDNSNYLKGMPLKVRPVRSF